MSEQESAMAIETVCIPVTTDEQVGHGWGKASALAVATVEDGVIASWRVDDVGWDALHDAPEGGNHHARIVRYLRENEVTLVVAGHMGASMQNIIGKMGIRVLVGASGDARDAITTGAKA